MLLCAVQCVDVLRECRTDASCHDCLDQRAKVLVLDGSLDLAEATAVAAEVHRLILQVALTALVADGLSTAERERGQGKEVSSTRCGRCYRLWAVSTAVLRTQSSGWLARRNSITPSLAFFTTGVSVLILMLAMTG